jgi:hypothetical protein
MTPLDRSRGTQLSPAETLQSEPERVGWGETIGVSLFLVLVFAIAILV